MSLDTGHYQLHAALTAAQERWEDTKTRWTDAVRQDWTDLARLAAAGGPALALLRLGRGTYPSPSLESYLEALLWEFAEALEARTRPQ